MLKVCLECHGSFPNGENCCDHKRVFRVSSRSCGGFLYEKGEIPKSKKERKEVARWSIEGEGANRKVYVNCVYCGSIDEASDHGFNEHLKGTAEIRNCIVCQKCNRHYWVCLEGWTYGNMAALYKEGEGEDDGNDNYYNVDREDDNDDDS